MLNSRNKFRALRDQNFFLLSLVRLLHLSKLEIYMNKDKIITSTSRGRWILVFTIAAF